MSRSTFKPFAHIKRLPRIKLAKVKTPKLNQIDENVQNSLKKRVSIEKCVFVTGSSIRMHLFIMRYTQTHFSLLQIKVLSSARFILVLLSVRCVRCTFPNKFNRQKQLQNLWNKCYSKVFFSLAVVCSFMRVFSSFSECFDGFGEANKAFATHLSQRNFSNKSIFCIAFCSTRINSSL